MTGIITQIDLSKTRARWMSVSEGTNTNKNRACNGPVIWVGLSLKRQRDHRLSECSTTVTACLPIESKHASS